MLIRSEEQLLNQIQGTHHKTCAYCKLELSYPRIVINDATKNGYHITCALQLEGDITADMRELLEASDAAELIQRVASLNFIQKKTRPASSPSH